VTAGIFAQSGLVKARFEVSWRNRLYLSQGWLRLAVPNNNEDLAMPRYVIERDIPGAGKLTAAELQGISQKSCGVLQGMGPKIQWVESFVTDDKIYCVYIAPNEAAVREHAKLGGFPANKVSQVRNVISPTTAE
jgi:hypothetical protein